MMEEIMTTIILIICGVGMVFGPILYFMLPRFVRSLRFYKIAKKYHLDFTMQKKIIHFKHPFQRNILTGRIKNHDIEIYDIYEDAGEDRLYGGTREREQTKVIIDGLHQGNLENISKKLKNLAPVSKIKNFLSELH